MVDFQKDLSFFKSKFINMLIGDELCGAEDYLFNSICEVFRDELFVFFIKREHVCDKFTAKFKMDNFMGVNDKLPHENKLGSIISSVNGNIDKYLPSIFGESVSDYLKFKNINIVKLYSVFDDCNFISAFGCIKKENLGNVKPEYINQIKDCIHLLNKTQQESTMRLSSTNIACDNLSHEFRTPLNAIMGFCTILSNMLSEKHYTESKQYIEIIRGNCEVLLNLSTKLISLNYIESYRMKKENFSETNIRDVVEEASRIVIDGIDFKELKIRNLIDEDCFVIVNKEMLLRIMMNIIENSILYSSSIVDITIKASICDTSRLRLLIIDKGRGMTYTQQRLAMRKFSSFGSEQGRLGIGLYYCDIAMQKMGGSIKISSFVNKGTVVSLLFENNR